MFCQQCGEKQPKLGHFCFSCGAELLQCGAESEEISERSQRPNEIRPQEPSNLESAPVQEMHSPESESNEGLREPSILSGRPHQWRRFFAHFIDLWVFGLGGGFALGFLGYAILPEATMDAVFNNPLATLVLLYAVNIPIEAAFLASSGTTLGKGIFGIRVMHQSGRRLSFGEGASRAFERWWRAEGCGIPIVILFTMARAYGQLKSEGITGYDIDKEVAVSHARWTPLRAVIVTVSTVVVFAGVVLLNAAASR